jgi:hypothetical protein
LAISGFIAGSFAQHTAQPVHQKCRKHGEQDDIKKFKASAHLKLFSTFAHTI